MKDLFIIGNGFDIAHHIKSKYTDFLSWLNKNYPSTEKYGYNGLSYPIDEVIEEDEAADFIRHCINDLTDGQWNQFEEELGEVDWPSFFDEVYDVNDKDDEIDYWDTLSAREDYGSALQLNSIYIERLFSLWVDDITYPKNIRRKKFLSDDIINKSFFFSFNYTKTLEDIYHVPINNICHIHGVKGGKLIIGHGNDEYYDSEKGEYGYEVIRDIQNGLRKPTKQIIKDNHALFKAIGRQQLESVYSWGFSFSDVDLCYIKEICNHIKAENITWYLNDYCLSEVNTQKECLKDCGFIGKVSTFHA